MTNPQDIEETLSIIRKAWGANPELRLCQLLSNASLMFGWKSNDLFYIEDEELRSSLKKYIKKD